MKKVFNKSFKPMNKETVPQVKTETEIENPELQRVFDLAAGIKQADPVTLEGIHQGLAQAKADQEAAAEAKETAETEAEFDKACDAALRAREKEAFFLRLLEKHRYTPRIDDETYDDAVCAVSAVVRDAAEKYLEIAESAMAELVEARADYLQIMKDADKVLSKLDEAANVLQVRYRYRVQEYSDGSSVQIEDPNEWTRHMIRYGQGRGFNLIARDRKAAKPDVYNQTACAAWRAAERVMEK